MGGKRASKEGGFPLPAFSRQEQLVNDIEKVCYMLPHGAIGQCKDFVDSYGKAVVIMLLEATDPTAICTMLHCCPRDGDTLRSEPGAHGWHTQTPSPQKAERWGGANHLLPMSHRGCLAGAADGGGRWLLQRLPDHHHLLRQRAAEERDAGRAERHTGEGLRAAAHTLHRQGELEG